MKNSLEIMNLNLLEQKFQTEQNVEITGESDAKILYLDGRASFDISDKSM